MRLESASAKPATEPPLTAAPIAIAIDLSADFLPTVGPRTSSLLGLAGAFRPFNCFPVLGQVS